MRLAILLVMSIVCNGFTFRYHTRFHGVDVQKGIRHIHSVEHVASTHHVGAPFFRVHDVLIPEKICGVASICFACSVLFSGKMVVRMVSKYTNRSEMHFRFKDGAEFVTIRLTVLPCLVDMGSHDFYLEVLTPKWIPKIVANAIFGISLIISSKEDKQMFTKKKFTNKNNCIEKEHHKQFSAYRKLVGI